MTSSKIPVHTELYDRPEAYKPWVAATIIPKDKDVFYSCGMTARGTDGSCTAPNDAVQQARDVFGMLGQVLEENGATLEDVVHLTVYLKDIDNAVPIQAVRTEIWPQDPPGSATVQIARFASEDLEIEIDAIAVIG